MPKEREFSEISKFLEQRTTLRGGPKLSKRVCGNSFIDFKPEFPELFVEWNASGINRVPLLTPPQLSSYNFIKRSEQGEVRVQDEMGRERARGRISATEKESCSAVLLFINSVFT